MKLLDRLKSWIRPDPADALKCAEDELLIAEDNRQRAEAIVLASNLSAAISLMSAPTRTECEREIARRQAAAYLPTPQHPNNQPLADPLGSEDAVSVSDDLHDV